MSPITTEKENEEAIRVLEGMLKTHEHTAPKYSPMNDYIEYVIAAIMAFEKATYKW